MIKKSDEPKNQTNSATEETIDWKGRAEDYLKSWQRTQADFENYRKRVEEERGLWSQLMQAETMMRFAPIVDDFRRAFKLMLQKDESATWLDGFRQIEQRLLAILKESGLVIIEETTQFNPQEHDAIAYEEHPELPDGSIIEVVEVGWKIKDKIIKPAKVRVSKGI